MKFASDSNGGWVLERYLRELKEASAERDAALARLRNSVHEKRAWLVWGVLLGAVLRGILDTLFGW